MGVLDVVRRAVKGNCPFDGKHQSRTFEFVGPSLSAYRGTISLLRIKSNVEKIEEAGELSKHLDMYQYPICSAT